MIGRKQKKLPKLKQSKRLGPILGECIGIKFRPRGIKDPHVMFQLMVEDIAGQWIEKGFVVSSHWLQDLIAVATAAKMELDAKADPEPDGYGYQCKDLTPEPPRDRLTVTL